MHETRVARDRNWVSLLQYEVQQRAMQHYHNEWQFQCKLYWWHWIRKRWLDYIILWGRTTTVARPNAEISTRVAATMPVPRSSELCWKDTKCSIEWKTSVYDAVATSKPIYGLERLHVFILHPWHNQRVPDERTQKNTRSTTHAHRQITLA